MTYCCSKHIFWTAFAQWEPRPHNGPNQSPTSALTGHLPLQFSGMYSSIVVQKLVPASWTETAHDDGRTACNAPAFVSVQGYKILPSAKLPPHLHHSHLRSYKGLFIHNSFQCSKKKKKSFCMAVGFFPHSLITTFTSCLLFTG